MSHEFEANVSTYLLRVHGNFMFTGIHKFLTARYSYEICAELLHHS